MKKYNPQLGALIATVLTLSLLPVRLSEGQAADLVNLIGSETVIWLLCMSIWLVSYHTYYKAHIAKWQRIVISLVFCAALSYLYYYASNPFFEDYPIKPIRDLPFWIALIRLSLRGVLLGLIMVPIIFLVETERERQREELQRAMDRAVDAERQKFVLEALVAERTADLEQTLSVLSASQDELDHQVYLLTRVVASIAHDINAPLKFIIEGAKVTGEFIRDKQLVSAAECNQQLERALSNMAVFMQNLLEFAKSQVHKGALHVGNVNLAALIREKMGLFDQILYSQGNTLHFAVDENLVAVSNANLLGVIVHNLLDNATKNTCKGKIEILTTVIESRLHLCIQNEVSGMGRDESDGKAQPDQPGFDSAGPMENSDGLGLILVRDISALLNVDFSIEDTDGKVIAKVVFSAFSASGNNSKIYLSTTALDQDRLSSASQVISGSSEL